MVLKLPVCNKAADFCTARRKTGGKSGCTRSSRHKLKVKASGHKDASKDAAAFGRQDATKNVNALGQDTRICGPTDTVTRGLYKMNLLIAQFGDSK